MNKVKILIVDDHTILREGLLVLLSQHSYLKVIGQASNGKEAIESCKQSAPDIVIMDLDMPVMNGIEATRIIVKEYPDTKIIILSMYPDHEYVQAALKAGAKGFLVKETAASELIQAVDAIKEGKAFFSPSISNVIIDTMYHRESSYGDIELLTSREREVLQLVAEGYTSKRIAKELFISATTVAKHRENILKKLNIHDTVTRQNKLERSV